MVVTASTEATDSTAISFFDLLQIGLDQVENLVGGEGLPQLA